MEEIKKLLLNEVNELYKDRHKKYKNKYSYEYYINMMLFLLKDVNNWSFLKNVNGYGNNNNEIPKYHYVTIKNKFNEWSKKGVFENTFKKYKNINNNTNLLYIDSTSIYNLRGYENIVINPENKKKKITKLSIISTKNGFITSIEPFINKQTLKNGSKTCVHDVKMINKTLENINNVNNKSKNFYLIADKAYKNKEKINLNNKPIKIITPDKKNAIKKNTKFENKKLKKRIIIEHCNLNLKRYERVMLRKEKKIKTYLSWVYISSLINNIRVNKIIS